LHNVFLKTNVFDIYILRKQKNGQEIKDIKLEF